MMVPDMLLTRISDIDGMIWTFRSLQHLTSYSEDASLWRRKLCRMLCSATKNYPAFLILQNITTLVPVALRMYMFLLNTNVKCLKIQWQTSCAEIAHFHTPLFLHELSLCHGIKKRCQLVAPHHKEYSVSQIVHMFPPNDTYHMAQPAYQNTLYTRSEQTLSGYAILSTSSAGHRQNKWHSQMIQLCI